MDNSVELQIPLEDIYGYSVVILIQNNQITIEKFIDKCNNLIIPCPEMIEESNNKIRLLKIQMDNNAVAYSAN